MTKGENWGGARPGAGRKPLAVRHVRIELRMPEEDKAKLLALGGTAWVLQKIREAEVPTRNHASGSKSQRL